jgi:hypothetical protein
MQLRIALLGALATMIPVAVNAQASSVDGKANLECADDRHSSEQFIKTFQDIALHVSLLDKDELEQELGVGLEKSGEWPGANSKTRVTTYRAILYPKLLNTPAFQGVTVSYDVSVDTEASHVTRASIEFTVSSRSNCFRIPRADIAKPFMNDKVMSAVGVDGAGPTYYFTHKRSDGTSVDVHMSIVGNDNV